MLEAAGAFLVETLQDRVRGEGKGVKSPGANTTPLAPLSPKYIKQRARERLHPETDAETSNLTRTGAMLDALRFRVTSAGLFVTISSPKELQKATYTNETRPWINLSKGEATKLREFVTRLMRAKAKE